MSFRNATFARVRHFTYTVNELGLKTPHHIGKAVMILGVWEDEGYALVRWLGHSHRNSFKIALSSLKDY